MNKMLHTPVGVKDYLVKEYKVRRSVENAMLDRFEKDGFEPIATPTFEYAEVFENMGSVSGNNMFRVMDRDGSMLALRPDMTPAIARIVATTEIGSQLPAKLSYCQNMFRHSQNYQGKLREFTQIGVELIGDNSAQADCEVISLAIESIAAAIGYKGMKKFKLDLGYAGFLLGVLDETGISDEAKNNIQQAIIDKNYVEVEELADSLDMSSDIKELLKSLPLMIGGVEVLDKAITLVHNETSIKAIEYLRGVYNYLKSKGYEYCVSFDLSVIGTMDYYTGIIFRGYIKGIGSSVVDGGRYDTLVARYGADLPAVGFAIKLNDIVDVVIKG